MPRTAISTTHAPAAIGPYSQAIRADGYLFCSGQLGLEPATGDFVAGDVAAQAEQSLRNLGAVLEAAGLTFDDVVKTTDLPGRHRATSRPSTTSTGAS